jgi:hypothetical protein
MYFCPKTTLKTEDDSPHELHLNGSNVLKVNQTKFLGVIIDDKLTWQPHIDHLLKKLACCTGTLNRIKDNIPHNLHKDLYHTLFESHLSYGITVWGNLSESKITPLFTSQKDVCVSCLATRKRTWTNSKLVPGRDPLTTKY